jgi:hypothetical protein
MPEAGMTSLTPYEKLEILRSEVKAREEELQAVEKDLRGASRALATHQYLKSVSAFYGSRPAPPEAGKVTELVSRRHALLDVIRALRAEMPRVESAAVSGKKAAAAPPRQLGRARFDT